jgi:hypothetical protein
LHEQKYAILRVDSLTLENNQCGECRLHPKKSKQATTFPADFCTLEYFGVIVSCYGTNPLIVALSPEQINIPSFRPWSPIGTGKRLDRAKRRKFQKFLND